MNWTDAFQGSDSIYGESINTKRVEFIGRYQLPFDERIIFSWSYTYHNQDSYCRGQAIL
jgi:outer membrane receptor for ferrienterochelin and colicins